MILRRDIPSSGWKKNKSKHGTCFNHGHRSTTNDSLGTRIIIQFTFGTTCDLKREWWAHCTAL